MAPKGVIPSPDAWRKITDVVRDVGRNRATRKARRMPRRRQHVGSGATEDDGFPPGTDGCDCGHCFQGVTIVDADGPTKCCTSHLRWELINPWLECEDTELTLEYVSDAEGWLSEPFDGPDCDGAQNEYRWQLTIDVEGRSYLTLVLETDNGCDPVCIIYGRDSFDCQCDNTFSLLKPYGTFVGVSRDQLSCYACLKPHVSDIGEPGKHCGDDTDYAAGYYINLGTIEDVPSTTCPGCDCLSGFWLATVNPTPWHNTDGSCVFTGCPAGVPLTATMSVLCPGTNMGANGYFVVDVELNNSPLARWRCLPEDFDPFGTSTFELYYDSGGCVVPDTVEVIAVPASGGGLPPSETGVCDETCDPPPAPVDPDPGVCCYQGVKYDNWTEALCAEFGGDWFPDGDDADCEAEVACCLPSGDCIIIDAFACHFLAGTPSGDSCDPNPCGGACCRSDGSCEVTAESDCQGPLEYYHGDGTDCGDIDCEAVACCESTEYLFCGTDSAAACLGASGTVIYPVPPGCSPGNPC